VPLGDVAGVQVFRTCIHRDDWPRRNLTARGRIAGGVL